MRYPFFLASHPGAGNPVNCAAGNRTAIPNASGSTTPPAVDAGLGRRILKAFDSQAAGTPNGLDTYEHIYLSGQQVIATRQATLSTAHPEALEATYQTVWSPRYIDALILRDENTDGDAFCDDGRVFYVSDANFNVTALVDSTGAVVERYVYTPYGEVTVLDPTFAEDADGLSDVSNVTLYTGREMDVATGLTQAVYSVEYNMRWCCTDGWERLPMTQPSQKEVVEASQWYQPNAWTGWLLP